MRTGSEDTKTEVKQVQSQSIDVKEIRKLIRLFLIEFAGSWGASALFTFVPAFIGISRGKRHEELKSLLARSIGSESLGFGVFVSLYFLLFRSIDRGVEKVSCFEDRNNRAMLAGALSSISCLFLPRSTRYYLAAYMAIRAAYSALLKATSRVPSLDHFSNYSRLASFMIISGQLGYLMFPGHSYLEPEYLRFLDSLSGMSRQLMEQIRYRVECGRLDNSGVVKLIDDYKRRGIHDQAMNKVLSCPSNIIGCNLVHPGENCLPHNLGLAMKLFRRLLAFYVALNFIPRMIFSPKVILHRPLHTLKATLKSAARTTLSMAAYSSLSKYYLCVKANLGFAEVPMQYWIMGFVGGSAVAIESSSRQIELSLYCAGKIIMAFDKMFERQLRRVKLPYGSFFLFSASMAIIMRTFRESPENLSPIVRSILSAVLREKHRAVHKEHEGHSN